MRCLAADAFLVGLAQTGAEDRASLPFETICIVQYKYIVPSETATQRGGLHYDDYGFPFLYTATSVSMG